MWTNNTNQIIIFKEIDTIYKNKQRILWIKHICTIKYYSLKGIQIALFYFYSPRNSKKIWHVELWCKDIPKKFKKSRIIKSMFCHQFGWKLFQTIVWNVIYINSPIFWPGITWFWLKFKACNALLVKFSYLQTIFHHLNMILSCREG